MKFDDALQLIEGRLWFQSFHIWGRFLEAGELSLHTNLFPLLSSDCPFFLRQWWLSELLGRWDMEGKQEQIDRLLFGQPGRGKRSFEQSREHLWRDSVLWSKIEQLRDKGLTYNKAIQQVTDELNSGQYEHLGIKEVLSPTAVRAIHKKRSP